jgi:hypothetical protein
MRAAALVGAVVLAWSAAARADDPKKQSLTVLLPTPVDAPAADALFRFTSDDKRLTVAVTYALPQRVSLFAQVSAPLDGDSRIARFIGEEDAAFAGQLQIGYDSRRALAWRADEAARAALALTPEERTFEDLKLCETYAIEPCTQSRIVKWMTEDHCDRVTGCSNTELSRAAPWAMAVERRNLMVSNIPSTLRNVEYWVGGDLAVAYDRLPVYRLDVATSPIDVAKWNVQVGANASLFLVHALALNLRVGTEVARTPKPKKFTRCQMLPSSDPTVTGQSCDKDALFLGGELPPERAAAYVRFAIDYEFHKSKLTKQDIIPGVEGRVGFEGLGATPSLALRFTAFFTPVIDPVAGQFGVGVDWSYTLRDAPDGSRPAGTTTVVPFAFVGARPAPILRQ